MRTIKDIPYLSGVKALVRADFNVSIKGGKIIDDFRIASAVPTIKFLLEKGAYVILISHLEVIEGESDSLEPVAVRLRELGIPVEFIKNYKDAYGIIDNSIGQGKACFLLENVRHNEGEKKNDKKFAKELSSLGDIYINEAFPVSHREHASIVGIPEFIPSYAGFQFEKEIEHLSLAFNPDHPFLFILGGAKFETKLPLVERFIKLADYIYVAGALANDVFLRKGYEIGKSMSSKSDINLDPILASEKLRYPSDVTLAGGKILGSDKLGKEDAIMDAGEQSLKDLGALINQSRFILWNGPLGMYEDGYKKPTLELAEKIAEATKNGAKTIVGGGDTLAAISELDLHDGFTFISTGGGAMLDYLAKGTLPGLEALK